MSCISVYLVNSPISTSLIIGCSFSEATLNDTIFLDLSTPRCAYSKIVTTTLSNILKRRTLLQENQQPQFDNALGISVSYQNAGEQNISEISLAKGDWCLFNKGSETS